MWENSLDPGWTAEERDILDQAVEFTIGNDGNPDFLEHASLFLSKISATDFTLVCQLNPLDQFQIQALSFVSQGALQPYFAYKLEGMPYDQVFGDRLRCFPFQMQKHFPENSDLVSLGIERFIGTTLNDENDDPIGLLVLMHCKPFLKVDFLEALLGIFSLPLEKKLRKLLAVQADI